MKNLVVSGITLVSFFTTVFAATVSDVTARQRWPWNGMVDIDCTIIGTNGMKYDTSLD